MQNVKKGLLLLVLSLNLAFGTSLAIAHDKGDENSKNWEEKRQEFHQKMMEKMAQDLNLSADQQVKIRTILDEQGKKMEDLHQKFAEKRRSLMEKGEKKILSNLNADQKVKYEQFKSEMRAKFEQRKEEKKEISKEVRKQLKKKKEKENQTS